MEREVCGRSTPRSGATFNHTSKVWSPAPTAYLMIHRVDRAHPPAPALALASAPTHAARTHASGRSLTRYRRRHAPGNEATQGTNPVTLYTSRWTPPHRDGRDGAWCSNNSSRNSNAKHSLARAMAATSSALLKCGDAHTSSAPNCHQTAHKGLPRTRTRKRKCTSVLPLNIHPHVRHPTTILAPRRRLHPGSRRFAATAATPPHATQRKASLTLVYWAAQAIASFYRPDSASTSDLSGPSRPSTDAAHRRHTHAHATRARDER